MRWYSGQVWARFLSAVRRHLDGRRSGAVPEPVDGARLRCRRVGPRQIAGLHLNHRFEWSAAEYTHVRSGVGPEEELPGGLVVEPIIEEMALEGLAGCRKRHPRGETRLHPGIVDDLDVAVVDRYPPVFLLHGHLLCEARFFRVGVAEIKFDARPGKNVYGQ